MTASIGDLSCSMTLYDGLMGTRAPSFSSSMTKPLTMGIRDSQQWLSYTRILQLLQWAKAHLSVDVVVADFSCELH